MEEEIKKVLALIEKRHSGLNDLYSHTNEVPFIAGHKMGNIDKPTYGIHSIQWHIAGSRGFVTILKTSIIGSSIFITKNQKDDFKISISRRKSFFGKLFSKKYTSQWHSYLEKELDITFPLE